MWQKLKDSKIFSYLSLFTSVSTLICCAIPSFLVLIGFGSSVAGFLNKFPQFIIISENKNMVFIFSILVLIIATVIQRRSKECSLEKRIDCLNTKQWSNKILILALGINFLGIFYSFILPLIV